MRGRAPRRNAGYAAAVALPAWHAPTSAAVAVIIVLCALGCASILFLMHRLRRSNAARAAAEAQLCMLREERRALTETRLVGIVKTRDLVIVWTNEAFAAMFGYEARELVGKPTRILYPSDAAHADFHDKAMAAIARGEVFRDEREHLLKDGRRGWFRVSCTRPAPGADEQLAMFVDVTERRATLTALRASEERLRRIFETMTEGLVLQDRDGGIVDANPAAIEILGVSRDQLFGKTSHDPNWGAIHADGTPYPGDEHPAMVTLRTGRSQRQQIMGLRAAGHGVRWLSINSTPIPDDREGTPAAVVSTFFDVTELRASYERIRELAQRLEVVRAEERRDVALSLHEGIAQDLFAAKLGVANLLHRIDRDPAHARAGEEVLRAVDKCMDDLRQIANELHPVAIAHQSLAQILSRHADEFGRASGLAIDVAELTPLPRLDEPVRLILFRAAQEVLINVARHASARRVQIVLRADDRKVSVEISDDGIGIHDAALEKPGSLGLVAIRERLGGLRGGFSIRRGEPRGTTATMYVPHDGRRG